MTDGCLTGHACHAVTFEIYFFGKHLSVDDTMSDVARIISSVRLRSFGNGVQIHLQRHLLWEGAWRPRTFDPPPRSGGFALDMGAENIAVVYIPLPFFYTAVMAFKLTASERGTRYSP